MCMYKKNSSEFFFTLFILVKGKTLYFQKWQEKILNRIALFENEGQNSQEKYIVRYKSEPTSFITLNRLSSLECKEYDRTFGYIYLSRPKLFFVISSTRSIHGTSISQEQFIVPLILLYETGDCRKNWGKLKSLESKIRKGKTFLKVKTPQSLKKISSRQNFEDIN